MRDGKNFIVGIDAGTKVGLCLLDMKGAFLKAHSEKHYPVESMVHFLSNHGRSVVVATDVNPAPVSIKKVATAFNSVLYTPERDLTVGEKNKILRQFFEDKPLIRLNNKHERDATASALAAYDFYKNKFALVENRLEKISFEGNVEEVQEKVIRGISVARAVSELGRN